MSYGPGLAEAYRIVGEYTGQSAQGSTSRRFAGATTTKVEFIVSLKAAKDLGLALPLPLVARAQTR